MKQLIFVLLTCPLFTKAQDLQTVTNVDNTTTNLLRITGMGKIPTTGAGLELFRNANRTVIMGYDRDNGQNMRLALQPGGAGSITTINETGGKLLVNGAEDGPDVGFAVNGPVSFTATPGVVKRGISIFHDDHRDGRTVLVMDANGGDAGGMDYFFIEHFAADIGARFTTANAAPLLFATNAADRMVLDANGNVGIGMLTPSEKLVVNGTVRATKVKVSQSVWPDFVFDSGYKLPSLYELERFIKQNGHLPGVPTECEVRRDGIDVGDNQAKLLQKVEELTLYIIDLNKQLEQQQAQIKELQVNRK
jgi:hypothetical protein